jgi:uncharacterized membrane protein YbaN (DUF454 family)
MLDWLGKKAKRILRIVGGFLLILLGIIGGFIPILQGWVFILAGLMLLAPEFAWARWLRDKLKDKAHQAGDWVKRHRRKEGEANLKHRDAENGD